MRNTRMTSIKKWSIPSNLCAVALSNISFFKTLLGPCTFRERFADSYDSGTRGTCAGHTWQVSDVASADDDRVISNRWLFVVGRGDDRALSGNSTQRLNVHGALTNCATCQQDRGGGCTADRTIISTAREKDGAAPSGRRGGGILEKCDARVFL